MKRSDNPIVISMGSEYMLCMVKASETLYWGGTHISAKSERTN